MTGLYLTNFDGEIGLSNTTTINALSKIKTFIDKNFKELITLDEQTKVIYIKGELDNSTEIVERFIVKINPFINHSEEVIIKVQGQDIKDKYDIIVKKDGIYIQDYKFIKDSIRKYA